LVAVAYTAYICLSYWAACFDLRPATAANLPEVLRLSLCSDWFGNMLVAFILHLADNHG
jgi:hypothetical protein